jgi:hypothetical protein
MIREEWRLHKSLIGGLGSGLFPLMIFIFTVFGALIMPIITGNIEIYSILLMLHLASFFYGFFVGGFGKIGEHVMTRRLGQVNMLLQLPQLYPVSFKLMMSVFYVKDSLYYLMYSFVPLVLGLGIAAPYAGVSYNGIGVLGVTLFLVFMLGMGLSFTLSTLISRSRAMRLTVFCLMFSLTLLVYPLRIIPVRYVLPALEYWKTKRILYLIVTALVSVGFAGVGALFTKEQYEVKQHRYSESFLLMEKKLSSIGSLRTLIAKEWLEIRRSGSLIPAITGFAGQLLVIYFVSWIFQTGFGLPLNFNVVFFSGFVGFMGVMTYSFLTNIEHNEYLNLIPVTVDNVVKAKLFIYFTITSFIIVGYVLLIGLLKGELHYVPVSLVVAASTSIFVVAVVAFLTGLWTNTMFFGAKTIMKFAVIVVPPLTLIEIASIMLQFNSQAAVKVLIGASFFLFIASWVIFTQLENKWKKTEFSYVSTSI